MKQRMTTADVAAEVACLRQRGILGMRLANIYDVSPRVSSIGLGRCTRIWHVFHNHSLLAHFCVRASLHNCCALPAALGTTSPPPPSPPPLLHQPKHPTHPTHPADLCNEIRTGW
jgi:hypothetical protein